MQVHPHTPNPHYTTPVCGCSRAHNTHTNAHIPLWWCVQSQAIMMPDRVGLKSSPVHWKHKPVNFGDGFIWMIDYLHPR